jgi:tRNA A37 methylthiotransferase MiaB
LFEVSEALAGAHLASLVGTRQYVLVEAASKSEKGDLSAGRVQGRTAQNEIVHLDVQSGENAAAAVGQVIEVEILRSNRHSLAGVPRQPLPPAALPANGSLAPDGRARAANPARHLPLV